MDALLTSPHTLLCGLARGESARERVFVRGAFYLWHLPAQWPRRCLLMEPDLKRFDLHLIDSNLLPANSRALPESPPSSLPPPPHPRLTKMALSSKALSSKSFVATRSTRGRAVSVAAVSNGSTVTMNRASWLPGSTPPAHLDGSMAADFGFGEVLALGRPGAPLVKHI